jgi:hypothetical protein
MGVRLDYEKGGKNKLLAMEMEYLGRSANYQEWTDYEIR